MSKRPNNTRFNPTTNGSLHVGHLYMMLVNEAEAHESGGKFVIRFDDNQMVYRYGVSWTGASMSLADISDVKTGMIEDVLWCGLTVDNWSSQEEREQRIQNFMRFLNEGKDLPVKRVYTSQTNPEVHWLDGFDSAYPYVPFLTAEKVLYDYLDGCNLIIRGEDLLDEWSLYQYFADMWGLPIPRQAFLKRLMFGKKQELFDIRKTRGVHSIVSYRLRGWSPEDLKHRLAEACLIDPSKPWLIDNCKTDPIWKL